MFAAVVARPLVRGLAVAVLLVLSVGLVVRRLVLVVVRRLVVLVAVLRRTGY